MVDSINKGALLDNLTPAAVALFVFIVYLRTLTPTVGLHDSGDLISAAYLLGVAHPTGYPLYSLMLHLWFYIMPLGNIAYRANVLSALFASATCMLLYMLIRRKFGALPSIFGAAALAFSFTFWQQATLAEKYTLLLLLFTCVLYSLLTKKNIYTIAFLLGLSFTHHMQTIFILPTVVIFYILSYWKRRPHLVRALKENCLATIFFSLPLLVYLYLPIAASKNPPINWTNPDNLQRFVEHITGRSYGFIFLKLGFVEFLDRLFRRDLGILLSQFNPIIYLFSAIGLIYLVKKDIYTFIYLTLIAVTNITYTVHYDIYNPQDYYLVASLIVSLLSGFGCGYIGILIGRFKFAVLCVFFVGIMFGFCGYFKENNRRMYMLAYDYARNILLLAEPSAVLVCTRGDENTFPLWYLYYIEKRRNDCIIINSPFIIWQWYVDELKNKYNIEIYGDDFSSRLKSIISGFKKNRAVYIFPSPELDKEITNNLTPQNLFFKVTDKLSPKLPDISLNLRNLPTEFKDKKTQNIIHHLTNFYISRGRSLLGTELNTAIKNFKIAQAIAPKDKFVFHEIGLAYLEAGEYTLAEAALKKAIKLDRNFAQAWANLALVWEHQKKDATALFAHATKLSPQNIPILCSFADYLYRIGSYTKAAKLYTKVIDLDKDNVGGLRGLSRCFYQLGKLNYAADYYKKLLSITPGDEEAKAFLKYYSTYISN